MKIKLADTKIKNFGSLFKLGQIVEAEIIGHIDHKIDAYQIMVDDKPTTRAFFPVSNGIDFYGNKYLICTEGNNTDKLYAFKSELAYVGELD